MSDLERRIDDLPASTGATDNHQLPAMLGGSTETLTVAQISAKVQSDLADDMALKAPLASPSFTGNPTAPTPASGDSDTSIATTAFVQGELAINPLTAKTTPVDADQIRIADSAASNAPKKLTFANLWAWISSKVLALFNASGSAPVYATRAWVNFNGTGTVAIRASGNVSSITDNGVGNYTVNFTTAMPNANYVLLGTAGNNNNAAADPITVRPGALASKLTTAAAFSVNANVSGANTLLDVADVNIAVLC